MTDLPVIIEVAVNGGTTRARNPHVPKSPAEIAADGALCLRAGASIIHSHIEDLDLRGDAAAARYGEGFRPLLREFPEAICYPTVINAEGWEERQGHLRWLVKEKLAGMGAFDPGSMNYGLGQQDGLPAQDFPYVNSYSDMHGVFARFSEFGLGASMGIYDGSYARAALAWHKAGKLPKGSFVKFYFGGTYDFLTGAQGAVSFGLPPTRKALDAYLEMFEGSNLPWAVAVLGGDVSESGLTRLALERGGHVRVGLEDFCGERAPANIELVQAVVALCRHVGRPIATPEQARAILGFPGR